MKKYTFLFIVLIASMNFVFSQQYRGNSFETWSNSYKFDQFNEDYIKIFGYSDFESWSYSRKFILFNDESMIAIPSINQEKANLEDEYPEQSQNSEVLNQSGFLTKEVNAAYEENNILVSSKINIYPNPVIDKMTVNISLGSNSDIEFSLFNSIGKIVYYSSVKDKKQILKTIDVENLNNGIYFLEIKTGNSKIIKKVIIK